jgi:hypothetical protein
MPLAGDFGRAARLAEAGRTSQAASSDGHPTTQLVAGTVVQVSLYWVLPFHWFQEGADREAWLVPVAMRKEEGRTQ